MSKYNAIPTGYPSLDTALGCGGFPRGRIVELYGPEGSAKKRIALRAIGECQRSGTGIAAYVDVEHDLDIERVSDLGVDPFKLLVSRPHSAERAFEIVETLARSGTVSLIVVDSIAGLVPEADAYGPGARLMGQALRKLAAIIDRAGVCVIFIHHLRMRVGETFGEHASATGRNALKFYSAMRLDVRRLEPGRTRVKVTKNKLAPPFTEAVIDAA